MLFIRSQSENQRTLVIVTRTTLRCWFPFCKCCKGSFVLRFLCAISVPNWRIEYIQRGQSGKFGFLLLSGCKGWNLPLLSAMTDSAAGIPTVVRTESCHSLGFACMSGSFDREHGILYFLSTVSGSLSTWLLHTSFRLVTGTTTTAAGLRWVDARNCCLTSFRCNSTQYSYLFWPTNLIVKENVHEMCSFLP